MELIKLPYRKGRLALRLHMHVLDSAHASAPWLSKNSIEEIYEVWKCLVMKFQQNTTRLIKE